MADKRKANFSSMVDLKAELFRKQEEYKQLKAHSSSDFVKGNKSKQHVKGDIWSKKNAGVSDRASRDLAQKEEEDNVMERSRKALEAKAKIYDKIACEQGIPDEDGSEVYLVDFQRKAVDRIIEQQREEGKATTAPGSQKKLHHQGGQDSDDDTVSNEPVPPPANPDEEWVDYVDSFGRSRRCMKKDLPDLQKQEHHLGKPLDDSGLKLKEGATLLSADMKRELRRQQWEKEAEEAADGPVHYSNVQFDEIRTHGTGFYQFSKDSTLREEQMDMLKNLREQTMENRARSERVKEKRKAALEARLAKVKQRRIMKGSSMMDQEKEEEADETGAQSTRSQNEQEQEPVPLTRDDSWRQDAPVREWDKGKQKFPEWNAKRYMEQKRRERESEFAPPQFYYDKQPPACTASTAATSAHSSQPDRRPSAGHGSAEKVLSSISNRTDVMLKQIRDSVEIVQNPARNQTRNALPGVEMGMDLSAIPLPMEGESTGNVKRGQEEGQIPEIVPVPESITRKGTMSSTYQQQAQPDTQDQSYFPQQGLGGGQGPIQQTDIIGPMPDLSVPPPGWCQPQSAPVPHQPSDSCTPAQDLKPEGSPEAAARSEGVFSVPASAFMYPSQQGLLSSLPQQPKSQIIATEHPPMVSTRDSKPAVPKVTMVDKRFMQNREASDEDLLGYLAQTSSDPLAKVQAVAYKPGTFSLAAANSVSVNNLSAPEPERQERQLPPSEAEDRDKKGDIPEAQTRGVIFGVPDFLEPAANIEAMTYQPGSFMAAKEAAAKRAEEQIEESRRKKLYSGAPVLYGKPEERQEDIDDKVQTEQSKETAADINADDEFAKFLKEVKGGK